MTAFFKPYHSVSPHRINANPPPEKDRNDSDRLARFRTNMNCSGAGPKGLAPSHAIEAVKLEISGIPLPLGGLEVQRPATPK